MITIRQENTAVPILNYFPFEIYFARPIQKYFSETLSTDIKL